MNMDGRIFNRLCVLTLLCLLSVCVCSLSPFSAGSLSDSPVGSPVGSSGGWLCGSPLWAVELAQTEAEEGWIPMDSDSDFDRTVPDFTLSNANGKNNGGVNGSSNGSSNGMTVRSFRSSFEKRASSDLTQLTMTSEAVLTRSGRRGGAVGESDSRIDGLKADMERKLDRFPVIRKVFSLVAGPDGKEGFRFGVVGGKDKGKGDLFQKNFENQGQGKGVFGQGRSKQDPTGTDENRVPDSTRAFGASYDLKW